LSYFRAIQYLSLKFRTLGAQQGYSVSAFLSRLSDPPLGLHSPLTHAVIAFDGITDDAGTFTSRYERDYLQIYTLGPREAPQFLE